MSGYWKSVWPAEDAGASRQQIPHKMAGPKLGARVRPTVVSRDVVAATMVVVRGDDEMYLLRHTAGDNAVSWVERIDPLTLEPIAQSVQLAGGPLWPGGMAVHENGSIYVVFGNHAHRLAPDLTVLASITLPRLRPYNSFVILPSGHIATKDFSGPRPGSTEAHTMEPTELLILEPEDLRIVARLEMPEPSIARLSADENIIYVVGTTSLMRAHWSDNTLILDKRFKAEYRTLEGQTFGWDAVIAAGSAWFLDNGEGSHLYAGTFRGIGVSPAPLHLVRVDLLTGAVNMAEICGLPQGLIANPPVIDERRCIAVGYDSGNGVITAFDFDDDGSMTVRWTRQQNHASHMVFYADTGELVTADYRPESDVKEQLVVLDIKTGLEKTRIDTASPIQTVVFPAVGANGDLYWTSTWSLTRVRWR